jgi:hypothetical protein
MKLSYKLTVRSARIVERLAAFDFQLEYKKGLTNPIDGLSRRLDYFANVIHLEAGHTRKRDSPARYFRDKSNF